MSKFVVSGRRLSQWLLGLALVTALTACGGGGGSAGAPVFGASDPASGGNGGTGPTATASDLVVVLDKSSVTNADTTGVAVTVTAIDANRNAVSGVGASFSVDSNGVITPAGTVTDASGQLKAAVTIGSDHTNRQITITVVSGSITRKVTFDVVDPPASETTPTAARLNVTLDRTNVGNSGGTPVAVTVTAVTAANNVLEGIPVTLAIDNNGTITPGGTTNAQGVVAATANIGSDKSNRLITVTATSGTLVQKASFQVTGAQLLGTAVPSLPTAGSSGNQVQYVLTDVNKNPMAGVAVAVTATGLTPPTASGTTDVNGVYTFTYATPPDAGTFKVDTTAGGANYSTAIATLTTQAPPTAAAVKSATLSAAPNVVSVNSAGTANLAAISARFVGDNNAPVRNVRVRFDLNGDPNSICGKLASNTYADNVALSCGYSVASSPLTYSDADGNVVTTYTPGTRSSPTNGVTVRACWGLTDADLSSGACPNSQLVTLTVVSQPVSISIGNDETVTLGNGGLTLIKSFVVQVNDASGSPKANVQITPSIDLVSYLKGEYVWDEAASKWVIRVDPAILGPDGTTVLVPEVIHQLECSNEDSNRNGVVDAGEDVNNSGQLEPRKSDVSITMAGSTVTDANGTAILQIQYPKSLASWVSYRITASAAGVLSPPAYSPVSAPSSLLPVDSASLTTENPPPAYVTSPYGRTLSCTIKN